MDCENFCIVDYAAMGERIRQARKSKKITQAELAGQIGVSTSYIGHIERGIKRCSIDAAAALCITLEIDANMLIFGKPGLSDHPDRDKIILINFLRKTLSSLED